MTLQTATLAGQMLAESLMLDTCRIERKSSTAPNFDPSTGEFTTPSPTVLYTGKCRVIPVSGGDTTLAGEQRISLWHFTVNVPVSVTGLQVDDDVIVQVGTDPDLIGKVLRIRHVPAGTAIVERRLGCEVNAG